MNVEIGLFSNLSKTVNHEPNPRECREIIRQYWSVQEVVDPINQAA